MDSLFTFFPPLQLLLAYISAALVTLTLSARRLRRRALNHLLRITGSHEEKNANMRLRGLVRVRGPNKSLVCAPVRQEHSFTDC